jgi:hypothetical protein
MDVLNFISWIKAGNYRAVLPIDATNLIAVGSKDPNRDDSYLPMAINAAPLQSLYDTDTVTQLTSITTPVTINAHNGVITTVSSTLAANGKTSFTVFNDKVTATSKVLLTVQYGGAATGIPTLILGIVQAGSFVVTIGNGGNAALNQSVRIHFMILN